MSETNDLLAACQAVMKGYPGVRVYRRRDGAVAIKGDRFTGLVRRHNDTIVAQAEGLEYRRPIGESLEATVKAVTLTVPLTRKGAINMVAQAIRSHEIEGRNKMNWKFRAWRDQGYHAEVPANKFSAPTAREVAAWLVDQVGRVAAAKATGERVKAAPAPAFDTSLAALRARLNGLSEALRQGNAALDKLQQDPYRYYPQFKNLSAAFKLAYDAGRIGMKLAERLEKEAKG